MAGIRVLDLTRVLAGPYCSMLLGDYGADVIKIERPSTGDDTRRWGPPFVGGESVYFLTVNRNKRSVAIDFGTDQGRQLVLGLAKSADVVVENFRPGTLDRLRLGYEDLRAVAPGIVYCSMTGFGLGGPRQLQPGYDALIIALGGLMSITGEPDGEPVKPGVAILDVAMGIAAQGAISAALLAKHRTGLGQRIDLSLFATQIGTLINAATNYLMADEVMERWGSGHPSIVPYQAFAAADGYIMIGAPNEQFWRKMCDVLQVQSLVDDPRFLTNADRVAHRDVLIDLISARVAQRTVEDWLARLEEADVPVAPINDIAQALADPQVDALGLIHEIQHPTAGLTRLVGPMVDFGLTPASIRRPPPLLGEHTDEVLGGLLGLGPQRLQELRNASIIA
jgi:crotonobetainyl-CoA:carnitine CoA-transferase CaiB-like acyl-CoA transferase